MGLCWPPPPLWLTKRKRPSEQVLKAVFPYVVPEDLGRCMLVCHRWRDVLTTDNYALKIYCSHVWPSVITVPSFNLVFRTFYKRCPLPERPSRKLSFDDLEFYVDFWADGNLVLSEVFPWRSLKSRFIPHSRNSYYFRHNLTASVDPTLVVRLPDSVSASLLVARKDCKKIACLIDGSSSHRVDLATSRAMASDNLDFSSDHPFIAQCQASAALLFSGDGSGDGTVNVVGVEFGFDDAPVSGEGFDDLFANRPTRKDMWTRGWDDEGPYGSLDYGKLLTLLEKLNWK